MQRFRCGCDIVQGSLCLQTTTNIRLSISDRSQCKRPSLCKIYATTSFHDSSPNIRHSMHTGGKKRNATLRARNDPMDHAAHVMRQIIIYANRACQSDTEVAEDSLPIVNRSSCEVGAARRSIIVWVVNMSCIQCTEDASRARGRQ